MRILVCGGAGYIGSHMVQLLLQRGHEVTVFDNLSTGQREACVGACFEFGDLADSAALDTVLTSSTYDAVMQFAAFIRADESVAQPGKYFRNNFCNTLNLLDAMVKHGVRQFIFSSTAAVYGEPQYMPIDEQHPLAPINPYGVSKRMVEDALTHYSRAYGMQCVPLRYFNAAGADPGGRIGPRSEVLSNLIPVVLKAAAGLIPSVKVFGRDYPTPDGTGIRDYIHVVDLCEAHLAAVDYLRAGGETRAFNLGTGHGYSVQEVIDAARRVTGREFKVITEGRRPGDPAQSIADPSAAMQTFGWKPRYGEIETIVTHAWAWQLKTMN